MGGFHRWGRLAVACIAGGALLVGVSACGDDDSGDDGTVTLKLAYVTTQQHPYGQAVDFFIKEVDTASGGRIKIEATPSYPQAEPQLLADVRSRTVDMATVSTAVWDGADIKSFQALQAPLLVTNYPLDLKILEGSIGTAMREEASKAAGDVTVLAIHEGGLRKPVGATKTFDSPTAFAGAKIRAPQSEVLATGLKALGAEADPLPLTEVYPALQNGTVDGMEANLGLIATQKFYEVAKIVTWNVNLWPFPTALTINNESLAGLSEEDQKILTDAAAKVPAESIKILTTTSTLPQDLANCGVKFPVASAEDVAALQTAAASAYTELSKDATNKKFIADIQALKAANPPTGTPPAPPTAEAGAECTLS